MQTETAPNGIETIRTFDGQGDRYQFDFNICTIRKGWAQVDTTQDASYYGGWANPTALHTMTFTEGDIVMTKYPDKESFVRGIKEWAKWSVEMSYGFKIDPGMCAIIIEAFKSLGLGEYLH